MTFKKYFHAAFAFSAVALSGAVALPAQAQTKAALTRDVDRPTAQPVNGTCSSYRVSGSIKCNLYRVPAGKRLVVETVFYNVSVAPGASIYALVYGEDTGSTDLTYLGNPNVFGLAPTPGYNFAGRFQTYTATQPLKLYVDENHFFAAAGAHASASNDFLWTFGFSGYVVDK